MTRHVHLFLCMKILLTVVVTLLVIIAAGFLTASVIAERGLINVAATADFLPGAENFFHELSEHSIQRHAAEAVRSGAIPAPPRVDAELLGLGRHEYDEMCVVCHGAPGVEMTPTALGMKPDPPELDHAAEEFSGSEIYWIIANGIRHTGMPAYGPTHSPEKIWALAAFVEQMEKMTPEEYAAGGKPSSSEEHSDHSHEH